MKKLAFALLLFLTTATAFAFGAKKSINPTDYTVTVHVVSSRYVFGDITGSGHQELDTVIDGQQVELRNDWTGAVGVLALGDYKAKPITNYKEGHEYIPTKPNGFDQCAVYQLLLPDGSTRDYLVIGLGPKGDSPTNP
jgi:hypothetical protein